MDPTLVTLEPERVNKLLRWWSQPEAASLLECLDKAKQLALVRAAELHSKSNAYNKNTNFEASASETLQTAAEYDTAIEILKSFFPDGPFISRIEL